MILVRILDNYEKSNQEKHSTGSHIKEAQRDRTRDKAPGRENSKTERSLNIRIMTEGAETRTDLKRSLGAKVQLAVHEAEGRLRDDFTKMGDRLFTMIDPILKEVVNSREDRIIASEHSEEMPEQLENHSKRLAKLEKN